MITLEEVKKSVDAAGAKANPPYRFSARVHPRNFNRIEVENIENGEKCIRQLSGLKRGSNPWKKLNFTEEEIESKVNEWGKKRKPYFVFNKMMEKNDKGKKCVEIKCIETNEVLIREFKQINVGSNPFCGRGVKYSDAILKNKINQKGAISNPKYSFVRVVGQKGSVRIIEVINEFGDKDTAQLANLMFGSNPWGKQHGEKEMIFKVNEAGKKSTPAYKFSRDTKKKNHTDRIIEVRHIKTKETAEMNLSILLRGANPWAIRYSDKEIELTSNSFGSKSSPKFKFVSLMGKNKHQKHIVKVINLETRETTKANYSSILKGHNPWGRSYSERDNRIRINKMGRLATPRFKFNHLVKRVSNDWKVEIQKVGSNETKICTIQTIINGANPFNNEINRYEENVTQPLVVRHLRAWGFSVKREVTIKSKNSRVDAVATDKLGRKYLIEVKSDPGVGINRWTQQAIDEQKARYILRGKEKFGSLYAGTYFVSPKGKQKGCISLKELKSMLLAVCSKYDLK